MVINAVVHVHVSMDNMALPVALSILNICTGQHDTMQNIIRLKARIATDHVTIFRAVLDSDIFSNFISVGSNIVSSFISAALCRTSLTLLMSNNSFCISMFSVWNSCPSVVRFILCTSCMSDSNFSISIDKSGVDRSGWNVSSIVGLNGL